jgi:hypothetical protein
MASVREVKIFVLPNSLAVSFCRASTSMHTALTGQTLVNMRRSLVLLSWLQVRIAPKDFVVSSSQITMSLFHSCQLLERCIL